MQVLHGCCAEDDEESHPQGGALIGDGFIGLPFFGLIVGFKNHGIEEKRQKAEHKEQLDKKDGEVFCVMLNARTGLGGQHLIDIMKVDPTGKQQDDEQDSRHLFVVLVE